MAKRWAYWSFTRALVKGTVAQSPKRVRSQANMSYRGSPVAIHSAAIIPSPPDCEKPGMIPQTQK